MMKMVVDNGVQVRTKFISSAWADEQIFQFEDLV
jgi:hypothetical protein